MKQTGSKKKTLGETSQRKKATPKKKQQPDSNGAMQAATLNEELEEMAEEIDARHESTRVDDTECL